MIWPFVMLWAMLISGCFFGAMLVMGHFGGGMLVSGLLVSGRFGGDMLGAMHSVGFGVWMGQVGFEKFD